MTAQLSLFGQAAAPTGARPVYATPQACTLCPAVATIFSRAYTRDGTPVDRCAACTASEVRRLRVAGLYVPAGFEWVP